MVTILVALLGVTLMIAAAMAVDITMQTNRQQNLHATLDAAAQAGAYDLPDSATTAKADALLFAQRHDTTETGSLVPNVDFWCIVAAIGSAPSYAPDITQIPSMCNPGAGPYTTASYPGLTCSPALCAIPCPATGVCNTIRVSQARDVPFHFGPAGGLDHGSTGALESVACKGGCGNLVPNPMNVVVVADRTGSMSTTDVSSMINGIESMFQVMTPSLQYVALGTIGRSATTSHSTANCDSTNKGLSWPSGSPSTGDWIPVQFANDYLSGASLNGSSPLVKGVNCLAQQSGTGTALASPMKAAARYLLGLDPNNLSSLPARPGTPQNVIIFETDGQPNEEITGGTTDLNTAGDIGAGTSAGLTACNNLNTVASNAKAKGILIITIAYNLSGARCQGSGTPLVTDTLAAAASDKQSGGASTADNACSTVAEQTAENSDGDYFFCAASGSDMASIFTTAIAQASKGIRLMNLP
ncbi:MAG: pilus assembly protein TadG-related protein [Mycobacteriaceae bacterium]